LVFATSVGIEDDNPIIREFEGSAQ